MRADSLAVAVEPRAGLSPERIDARATAEQLHCAAKVSAGVKVKVDRYPKATRSAAKIWPNAGWISARSEALTVNAPEMIRRLR